MDYAQKKEHLGKMLQVWNGKIEFLTALYKYVEKSDDSVDEEVRVTLYDGVIDLMVGFQKLSDEEKKRRGQELIKYYKEQAKKDQEWADDILDQI